MSNTVYSEMTDQERAEIRMYGVTVEQMCEAVTESITFRMAGPVLYVASMLSDAQEMVAYEIDDNLIEDQRQLLNRAKWILDNMVG